MKFKKKKEEKNKETEGNLHDFKLIFKQLKFPLTLNGYGVELVLPPNAHTNSKSWNPKQKLKK